MRIRTVASAAVRSVNKSRDIQNCISNASTMRSVTFSIFVYITKPWKLILCDLICQITCNYNHINGGHCDSGSDGHCRWRWWQPLIVWSKKNLRPVKPIENEKEWVSILQNQSCIEWFTCQLKYLSQNINHYWPTSQAGFKKETLWERNSHW